MYEDTVGSVYFSAEKNKLIKTEVLCITDNGLVYEQEVDDEGWRNFDGNNVPKGPQIYRHKLVMKENNGEVKHNA